MLPRPVERPTAAVKSPTPPAVPTATMEDLRVRFPRIRKLLEREGEVVLMENGLARYRLIVCPRAPKGVSAPVDYWARLTELQPAPIRAASARQLHRANRGSR